MMSYKTGRAEEAKKVNNKSSVVIACAMLVAIAATGASAQNRAIEIPLNKSTLVPIEQEVSRVSVGQPEIADILITNPEQLYILGKSLGTTNVVLWDENDQSFAQFEVSVTHDLRMLKAKLHELFPGESPGLMSSQDRLVVSGEISNPAKMDAILEVAESFVPRDGNEDGPRVLNLMQIGGVQQVMLEVKVAELSRTVLRRLGVNLTALRPGGDTRIGLINGGASFPDALTPDDLRVPLFGPLDGSNTPIGPAVDEFSPNDPTISGPGLFLSFLDPAFFLQTVINAAKETGLAKILAEPTLVTLSGQEAQFLSGGEFPIPVDTGDGSISVEFKEFGIGLRFLPVVLDTGRVSLKVNVSVSELVTDQGVTVGVSSTNVAFSIPALTKRSTQSTVELNHGESLAIAGLISDNLRDAVNKFPGLGDVPLFGQLFRSQEFQQDNTELVVFVTANLARPMVAEEMRLPTDGLVLPSDAEYYLLGKPVGKHVETASEDTGLSRVVPGVATEFGHDIGNAER
jgi:pilus assembly protein CpaC